MDDAEELEKLGHHGIGNRLNRDQEADLSIRSAYRPGLPSLRPSSSMGRDLHPFVSLLFGLSFTICGVFLLSILMGNPADRIPEQLRAWPSVIANVERSVRHDGRTPKYDMTFRYKVAAKSYWFKEGMIPEEIHLSEVRYDPMVPSHFFRVQLQAEGYSGMIAAVLVLLIGITFVCAAVSKWRSRDGSFNWFLSGIFLIFAVIMILGEFTYCFNPKLQKDSKQQAAPYSVASSEEPG